MVGALVTTIGSELYPVTTAGRILGFVLMLYAIGIFTYFFGSVASVLVALDARPTPKPDKGGVELSDSEVEPSARSSRRPTILKGQAGAACAA